MNYDEARSKIQDGDLIAVRGTEGFLSPFTRFFTRSPYTHVGVAFWMGGGLWLAEINAGANHATPLSQFAGTDFDVYEKPYQCTGKMIDAIDTALRVKIHYGFASLPVIGLMNWLRVKAFIHARKILSCAGFAVMIYELAGFPEHTRILSPADLAATLKPRLSVQADATQLLNAA